MTLWVGTYQAKGGKGLVPLLDRDGHLLAGDPEQRIANASFVVGSLHRGLFYFVDEQEEGRVTAWKRNGSQWTAAGSISSAGALPCYLALSPDGRLLAVANYADGSLALIKLDVDTGSFQGLEGVHRPTGHGRNPERQDGPHAHCAVFTPDGGTLYHVDLGLDRVFAHDVSAGLAQPPAIAFEAPAGAGPRHLVLHPDGVHALLICELASRLMLLRREGTALVCLDDVPTQPVPTDGNLAGHLALDADGTILVTNRGHDSLVRFAVKGECLVMREWRPTGGASPRHFLVSGAQALIAHEQQGGVTRVRFASPRGHELVADLAATAFIIDIPD